MYTRQAVNPRPAVLIPMIHKQGSVDEWWNAAGEFTEKQSMQKAPAPGSYGRGP
jgi:hypothetical protein